MTNTRTRTIAQYIVSKINQHLSPPTLRYETFGNAFPDKKFLLIRRNDKGAGLFSLLATTLGWIKYADENGYIPVIDFQHYPTLYTATSAWFRRKNAWSLFFDQPTDFTVSDIKRAQYVTIATGIPSTKNFYPGTRLFRPNTELPTWKHLFRKYIRIKSEAIQKYSNPKLDEILSSGRAIIGVLARGTDYVAMRPIGHTVQPSIEMLLDETRKMAAKHSANHIYLVSEDKTIIDHFKEAFGNALILSKQTLVNYNIGYLGSNKSVRGNVEMGRSYLKAVLDLSRCPYIVAGQVSGSVAALLMTNGFQDSYFFNLGYYK